MNTNKMHFGQVLKQLRIEKGLSQKDIAQIFDLIPSTVSYWENNKNLPNVETLIKIATYFGVTLDELLGLDENVSITFFKYSEPEIELISKYRNLTNEDKLRLEGYADSLIQNKRIDL